MTLQQLRNIVAVAQYGSFNLAAQKLFLSQPSLSNSIADLEREMGITIFVRNVRGAYLTDDGSKFLAYARQVTEQAEILENKFKNGKPVKRVFAVSSQHYAFAVNAFVTLVKEYGEDRYEFSLRETRTADILEDVRTNRSELGILYMSRYNQSVILGMIRKAEMMFTPLYTAKPHIFVSKSNPLAKLEEVTPADLAPYPRLTYEQGVKNSFYFAEELLSNEDSPKNIVVTDRATLFNLLIGLNGYTICSGILSANLNGTKIVSVPLRCDDEMQIGYIRPIERPLSPIGERYIHHLNAYLNRCGS